MAILPMSELPGWRLADPSEDLRGLPLVDEDGRTIGTIVDLPVDMEANLIEKVVLDNGEAYPIRLLRRNGRQVQLQQI